MPRFVVDRTAEALNTIGKPIRGAKIGILGVAYKKDIDDPRESPSFKLMELLGERGAQLSYSDPHIPNLPAMRSFDVPALTAQPLSARYLQQLDCCIIATDHSAFDYRLIVDASNLVIDTRNATRAIPDPDGKVWKS
jgi:UDP-N-acetyl-D-glucosamine dehydrogenase